MTNARLKFNYVYAFVKLKIFKLKKLQTNIYSIILRLILRGSIAVSVADLASKLTAGKLRFREFLAKTFVRRKIFVKDGNRYFHWHS